MSTRIYGRSDDLIEFEGDFDGEVGCYGEDGSLIVVSDGTLLEVKYGKNDNAIWGITLIKKGASFLNIEQCDDEDADIYSDIANFENGIKWAYAAKNWEKVH